MTDSPEQDRPTRDDETDVYTVVMQPPPPVPPTAQAAGPAPAGQAAPPQVAGTPAALGPPAATPPATPPMYPPYQGAVYAEGVYRGPVRSAARGPFGTAARVVFAAVVLLVFGLAETIGGGIGAIVAASLRRVFDQLLRNEGLRIDASALTGVLIGLFVALLVVGVIHLVAAAGVLAHQRWGRWLGVAMSMVALVAGAWFGYRAFTNDGFRLSSFIAPLAFAVPYLVTLLALLYPADHFRRGGRSR